MKNRIPLFLLGVVVVIALGAVGSTTISYYNSVSISQTNFVHEVIITNGLTLGGVRKTTPLMAASSVLTNLANGNSSDLTNIANSFQAWTNIGQVTTTGVALMQATNAAEALILAGGSNLTNIFDSVTTYGADPSGVTNSYSAFTNALAAVAISGKTLKVPPGSYLLNSGITWPDKSNISLVGDGIGKSVLNFNVTDASQGGFTITSTTSITNTTIRGLSIIGISACQQAVLIVDNVSYLTVEDCEIAHQLRGGVTCQNDSPFLVVRHCYFADIGPASSGHITLLGDNGILDGNTILDTSTISSNTMHAIYVGRGNALRIVNNYLTGLNGDLQMYSAASVCMTNATVSGNILKNVGKPSPLYNLYESGVFDNTFVDAALFMSGCNNSRVHNNTFQCNTNSSAITLNAAGSTNCDFSANYWQTTNTASVYFLYLGSGCMNCLISGNHFLGGDYQLSVAGGGWHTIQNNLCDTAGVLSPHQIYVTATNCTILWNKTFHTNNLVYAIAESGGGARLVGNDTSRTGAGPATSKSASSISYYPGGVIAVSTTAVGTTNSLEVGLITNAIPANTLRFAGDTIQCRVFGTFLTGATNKTVTIYFGTQQIFTTGALAFSSASWDATFLVTRKSSSTAKSIVSFISSSALLPVSCTETEFSSTLTAAQDVHVTGTGINDNDVVQSGSIINLLPSQ